MSDTKHLYLHPYISLLKRVILLLLLALPILAHCQCSKVSFYVAAHPDDWQLFMGASAFNDIKEATTSTSNKKVVIVYLTAGEGNCDGAGLDTNYYLARMEGANRSVHFCADINSRHTTWSTEIVTIHGKQNHQVKRSTYKNIVSYYLLLPDGCFEQKATSLQKLARHAIPRLDAIDSSTSYNCYNDLVQTVRSILNKETEAVSPQNIVVHAQEWDKNLNPRDHPDHLEAGNLVALAIGNMRASLFLYSGYCTDSKEINLQTKDIAAEAALISQIRSAMVERWYDYGWDQGHVSHILRNYYRKYKPTIDVTDAAVSSATSSEQDIVADTAMADNVYPNPSSSTVTVTYNMPEAGPVRILLYDALGNMVSFLRSTDDPQGNYNMQYDLSSLPAGSYIMAICKHGAIRHIKFEKE
jgi:LmbE family N-acetylglucosaminyl deacetylase